MSVISEQSKILKIQNLSFYYNNNIEALKDINMEIEKNKVTALIGPSGCGKTTLLRCINRMHDLYPGNKYEGKIIYNNLNLLELEDITSLRSQIGMVFQSPTAFPMSVFDNIAYGLKLKGIKNKKVLKQRVEKALKDAALFDEVKDKLNSRATELSGGQQQRLCIARALAVEPEIILFDEPTSALDPISTGKIEDLIYTLKKNITIVIVTHNMQQAARISDYTAFMYLGKLVEYDKTDIIFTRPKEKETENYITGKFG
ncbi:MAG: phosphate ABC transporter ATP-binding protein PstB [Deferribacterota bacterium]|nr:phosphate ABC transporter ATP-binding protein PstB [Deferribacterota bacterium]